MKRLEKVHARVYRTTWRGRGWKVAFTIMGKNYSRYFSDALFGSTDESQLAAQNFAGKIGSICDELNSLHRRFNMRDEKSSSGFVGVSFFLGGARKGPSWIAYWTDSDGKRRQRSFAVSIHGYEKAKCLAVDSRREAMRRMHLRYEAILECFESGAWKVGGGVGPLAGSERK